MKTDSGDASHKLQSQPQDCDHRCWLRQLASPTGILVLAHVCCHPGPIAILGDNFPIMRAAACNSRLRSDPVWAEMEDAVMLLARRMWRPRPRWHLRRLDIEPPPLQEDILLGVRRCGISASRVESSFSRPSKTPCQDFPLPPPLARPLSPRCPLCRLCGVGPSPDSSTPHPRSHPSLERPSRWG